MMMMMMIAVYNLNAPLLQAACKHIKRPHP
jgi:hypothetical protein